MENKVFNLIKEFPEYNSFYYEIIKNPNDVNFENTIEYFKQIFSIANFLDQDKKTIMDSLQILKNFNMLTKKIINVFIAIGYSKWTMAFLQNQEINYLLEIFN